MLTLNTLILGEEGSGTDRLVYRVPAVDGSSGVEATVRLHYQAVPAQWVAAMFEFSDQSERIANFESMYDAADRTPVVVAEQRAMGWPGFDPDGTDWRLAPNPVHDGQLLRLIPAGEEMPLSVELFDMSGRHIRSVELGEMLTGHDVSDLAAGNYLVKLGFAEHFSTVRWMKSLN